MSQTHPTLCMILCEGYHDRNFLSELLVVRLGWRAIRNPNEDPHRHIKPGSKDFVFVKDQGNVRLFLHNCEGQDNILSDLALRMKNRDKPSKVLLVYDGDWGGDGDDFLSRIQERTGDALRQQHEAQALQPFAWSLPPHSAELRLAVWRAEESPGSLPHAPDQQCIERLICASAATLWPHKMQAVSEWLQHRPEPPHKTTPKSYNWSLMAGWFPDQGCDDFFREVWREPSLSQELERRLRADGTWSALEWLG